MRLRAILSSGSTMSPVSTVPALSMAAMLMLVTGCGSSAITADKLQASIGPTFGQLYVQEQLAQGDPRPVLAEVRPRAHCLKGTPGAAQHGAGSDWVCYVTYTADGPGTDVIATYNVTMQTDGCYSADGDGPTSLNGSRTITGAGYRQVLNPLWLIDGCFDVG